MESEDDTSTESIRSTRSLYIGHIRCVGRLVGWNGLGDYAQGTGAERAKLKFVLFSN
jgi:hypothetical protein